MKFSINSEQIKQKLYTYHISGNDRNLADHGSEREYLYSVGDGYRLLLSARAKLLNNANTFPALTNEENSAYRENLKRIFLSDPYHTDFFDEYFEDDISRIMNGKGEQAGWQNMPETIIIPIIDGIHWRLIRIKINYTDKDVEILWDDPFGKIFSENLRSTLKVSIKDKIIKLIKRQYGDLTQQEDNHDFLTGDNDYFKVIDQQGRISNFYDCGPIVFSNIRDYIRHNDIENQRFSQQDDYYYTIKLYSDPIHEHSTQRIRKQDRDSCVKFANPDLIDINKLDDLYTKITTKAASYKQNLGDIEIESEISKLPDSYISLFHEIIQRNRINSNEILESDDYTQSELRIAYQNLQEEVMSTPIEKIGLTYKKFRELKRYHLDPYEYSKENFALAAYKFANFHTMDGPDLQVDIERNLEEIQRNIDVYKDSTNDFIKLGVRILHDPDIYWNIKLKIIESLGLFGRNLLNTEKRIVMQHLEPIIRFQDRAQNYQMLETALKSSFHVLSVNYELSNLKIWLKKYFVPLFKDPDFSMGVLYNPGHFSQKKPIARILFDLIESSEDKREICLFFLEELHNPNWEVKSAISSIFSAPSEHGIALEELKLQDIFSILSSFRSILDTDIADEYYTERTVLNLFKAKKEIFYFFNNEDVIYRKIVEDHFSLIKSTNIYHIFLRSTEFFIPFYYNDQKRTNFLKDKTPLREIIGEDGIINLLQILLLRVRGIALEKTIKFSVFSVSDVEDIKDRAESLLTLFAYDISYSNHPALNWNSYEEYSNKKHDQIEELREILTSNYQNNYDLESNSKTKRSLKQAAEEILESSNQEYAESIFRNVVGDIYQSELRNKSPKSITFFIKIYMDSDFSRLKYMAMEELTNIIKLLYKNTSALTIRTISRLSNIEERLEYREIIEQIIEFYKHGIIENPTVSQDLKEVASTKLTEIIARNPQLARSYTEAEDNSIILGILGARILNNLNSYLPYFARAQFLIDTSQDLELALQDLNKAQKLNDFYAPIYYYKALYFERKKDISGAIHQLEMAIDMRPCYVEAYNKKIALHYEENDWVMARIVHEEIISLYPEYTAITQSYIRKITKDIDVTDIPFKSAFDEIFRQLDNFSDDELEGENSLKMILKKIEEFVPEDILDFCVERYQPSHADQLNDHLNEKRRFLEDFIKYVILNTVYSEYSQHYVVFQNEEERATNLEKLFEESKIHKIFGKDNPITLIAELRQYCEVYTIFEFIKNIRYQIS